MRSDQILRTSRVLADRERACWPPRRSAGHSSPACWSASPAQPDRARHGYSSFFGLQVADYGMTVDEMWR